MDLHILGLLRDLWAAPHAHAARVAVAGAFACALHAPTASTVAANNKSTAMERRRAARTAAAAEAAAASTTGATAAHAVASAGVGLPERRDVGHRLDAAGRRFGQPLFQTPPVWTAGPASDPAFTSGITSAAFTSGPHHLPRPGRNGPRWRFGVKRVRPRRERDYGAPRLVTNGAFNRGAVLRTRRWWQCWVQAQDEQQQRRLHRRCVGKRLVRGYHVGGGVTPMRPPRLDLMRPELPVTGMPV